MIGLQLTVKVGKIFPFGSRFIIGRFFWYFTRPSGCLLGGGGNGTGVDAGNGSEGIRINQQRKERVIGRARRYPSDAINKQTSWGMKTLGTPLKDWRIKLGW